MLKDGGYISASLTAYSQVVLTPKGRAYRSKLATDTEEHTNERTYVRAENRTTKIVAVIAAVASVVAAILKALIANAVASSSSPAHISTFFHLPARRPRAVFMRFSCVWVPALSYWYLPFRERPWAGKDVIAIEGMLSGVITPSLCLR